MGLPKSEKFLLKLAFFISAWSFCVFGHASKYILEKAPKWVFFVKACPLWLVVSFGFYSCAKIGFHLIKYRRCPEERDLLQEDIEEAKKFYADKGVVLN
eukprot:TRINITY_DN2076_c0_g2_i1.p1 TRINITY_DN2076_c0_g2~~TRINITY_DN2076_c0_g2_i1.p1  ORF type:complete len:109 (+),score=20.96 TRINITY_DN2076_c0_g2_i1:33-329(+)